MANSADTDQTAPSEQSDQDLHSFLRPGPSVPISEVLRLLWYY